MQEKYGLQTVDLNNRNEEQQLHIYVQPVLLWVAWLKKDSGLLT